MFSYLRLLFVVFVSFAMNDNNYINFKSSIFKIETTQTCQTSLYQALATDTTSPFATLESLLHSFRSHYNKKSPYAVSLCRLYTTLYPGSSDDKVKELMKHDLARLKRHGFCPATKDVRKEAMIYSLFTGVRVVLISPSTTGFDTVDTLEEFQILSSASFPRSQLPITATSPTQFVYNHAANTFVFADKQNLRTYSVLTCIPKNSPSLHRCQLYCGGSDLNVTTHLVQNSTTSRYRRNRKRSSNLSVSDTSVNTSSTTTSNSISSPETRPIIEPSLTAPSDSQSVQLSTDFNPLLLPSPDVAFHPYSDPLSTEFHTFVAVGNHTESKSRKTRKVHSQKVLTHEKRHTAQSTPTVVAKPNTAPLLSSVRDNSGANKRKLSNHIDYSVQRKRQRNEQQRKRREADCTFNERKTSKRHERTRDLLSAYIIEDFDITPETLQDLLQRDPQGELLFMDRSKNPIKAVLLHYLNSGLFSFQRWKEYCTAYDKTKLSPSEKEALRDEILDEKLSDDELHSILDTFLRRHCYTQPNLYSCGACGLRQFERDEEPRLKYERCSLDDENLTTLLYTEKEHQDFLQYKLTRGSKLQIPLDDSGKLNNVDVWKAISVYTDSQDHFWHLHPELVHKDPHTGKETTMLCPDCMDSLKHRKRPKLSIASGLDFCNYSRLGLTLPNLHEQLILSRTRLFFAALKISSNKKGQTNFNLRNLFKCHAVLFPCQEAELINYLSNSDIHGPNGLMDVDFLKQLLSLFCIDDNENPDHLMQQVFGSNEIIGRSWVIAQWILVLQRLNQYYFDLDVTDTSRTISRIADSMNAVKVDLMTTLEHLKDHASNDFEARLGSDVCQNQNAEATESDNTKAVPSLPSNTPQSIRYSYVTNNDEGTKLASSKDYRLKALSDLANLNSDDVAEFLRSDVSVPSAINTENEGISDSESADGDIDFGHCCDVHPNALVIENIDILPGSPNKNEDVPAGNVNQSSDLTCSTTSGFFTAQTSFDCSPPPSSLVDYSRTSASFSSVPYSPPHRCASHRETSFLGLSDASESQYSMPPPSAAASKDKYCSSDITTKSSQPKHQQPRYNKNKCTSSVGSDDSVSTFCTLSSFKWTDDDPPPIAAEAKSGRQCNPYNEFESGFEHYRMLGTTFPHVFMKGISYDKPVGRLSHKERFHLLNQFSLVPSQDRRLLGFLFDMLQRIRVMDGVKAHVISSRKSLRTIETLLTSPSARADLKTACENPDLPKSRGLLNKYLPHLKFASQNVPYSAVGGAKFEWYAMEMNKRFSAPNNFLTISPSNLDNPRSIRLAFSTTSNHEFPAQFDDSPYGCSPDDFIRRLQQNSQVESEGNIRLPPGLINRLMRADLAMNNPVAFVLESKMILNDVLSILIGLDPEDMAFFSRFEATSKRKTTYYKAKKGIFGHPLYAIGVTEDHSRGTLHWHITLLAGLPPYVLQTFYNLNGLCDHISSVLDSMYTSQLSESLQIGSIVKDIVKQQKKDWSIPNDAVASISNYETLLHDPTPRETLDDINQASLRTHSESFTSLFNEHATLTSSSNQHHRHLRTCHKGFHGRTGCRFDLPCGQADRTGGVLLLPNLPPPNIRNFNKISNNRYCLQVNNRDEKATHIPSYALPPSPTCSDSHIRHAVDVLDPSLPDSMVFWQTASPDISPSLLPSQPTLNDNVPNLAEQIADILRRLPEFDPVQTHSFHDWLLHKSTPEQIFSLWSTVLQQLPQANRMVPSFNPALSWCTGSHNNASLLGAVEQAKSALFYLVPYQGKSKFPLSQSLTILNSTLQHIDRNKSQHPEDSGTLQRTTKHFLTRALNRMSLQMEISDYEIAAALLDLPSVISSERFSVGNPSALSSFRTATNIANDIDESIATSEPDRRQVQTQPSTFLPHLFNQDVDDGCENNLSEKSLYKHEDVLASFGPIKKINISNDPTCPSILVPEVSLYLQRSPLLERLSYYEFLACVGFRKGKPTEVDNPDNLQTLKHFHLLPTFPGRNDSYHVLLKKQATPLFVGKPPPHPGYPPRVCRSMFASQCSREFSYSRIDSYQLTSFRTWKARADSFARYYLTLFRPHRSNTCVDNDSPWEDLQQWVTSLRNDSSIISKFRLMILHQHIRGLRSKPVCKKMARDYRSRNRKHWTRSELLEISKRNHHKTKICSKTVDEKYDKHLQECLQLCSPEGNKNMLTQLKHESKQIVQLDHVYGSTTFSNNLNIGETSLSHSRLSNIQQSPVPTDVLLPRFSLKKIQQAMRCLKEWSPQESTPWESSARWWHKPANSEKALSTCAAIRRNLQRTDFDNSQQLHLYDLYANFFMASAFKDNNKREKPPQIVLCHGGPGVGKSVMRDSIDAAAQACHRFTFKTSFNAINAVKMNGSTTSSALKLDNKVHCNTVGTFSDADVRDLRSKGFNSDTLVIVEEISNQAPWHLARLNSFCQTIVDDYTKPFGGVLVLLVGDLTQLGPVKASHLTDSVMDISLDHDLRERTPSSKKTDAIDKPTILPDQNSARTPYSADHPYVIGSRIFTLARWYELSKQQRSIDDVHTQLVQNNYLGKRLSLDRLKRNGYRILSREDGKDPDWVTAPILVSTNRERYTFTHHKAIHVAKHLGTVVFRWNTKWSKWKQRPVDPKHEREALNDPCFYEYFVAGADGFLTDNIQKHLNLTNATAVKFHSIKVHPRLQKQLLSTLSRANPGDIITLPEPPAAVNVEIEFQQSHLKPGALQALRKFSLGVPATTSKPGHSNYVIPLYEYSCKASSTPTTVRGGKTFLPSKVTLQKRFPVEPAFAITVHKSEGRTLSKVIIALSNCDARGCNFSFSQVHVAFSRVRRRSDIRLLLTGDSDIDQWRSLTYLGGLRPKKYIKFFFDGHRNRSHTDPNRDWKEVQWSARRANASYRLHLHNR